MVKKRNIVLSLFLVFFSLISMSFVSSADVYLNQCDNTISFSSNNNYLINFSTIPSSYTAQECFKLGTSASKTNINISMAPSVTNIVNLRTTPMSFISLGNDTTPSTSEQYDHVRIHDISYTGSGYDTFFNFSMTGTGGVSKNTVLYQTNIYNIKTTNMKYFINHFGSGNSAQMFIQLDSVNFTNITSLGNEVIYFSNTQGGGGISYFTLDRFSNSLLEAVSMSNQAFFISGASVFQNTNFSSIGLLSPLNTTINVNSGDDTGNTFYSSMISLKTQPDADNNGIADSNIYPNMFNSVTYITKDNITFVQSPQTSGGDFITSLISSLNNSAVFFTNPMVLNGATTFLLTGTSGKIFDFSSNQDINLTGVGAIDISTNGRLDCFVTDRRYCNLDDEGNGQALSVLFTGVIYVGSDSFVRGINYTSKAVNDDNVISNNIDGEKSNITIMNNIFNLTKNGNSSDVLHSHEAIMLRATDINMRNNSFYSYDVSNRFEFLYIDSSDPTSNVVTLNRFNQNTTTPTGNNNIFKYQCDTNFYNNYVGSGNVLSENASCGNLNASVLVYYLHSNGNLYAYRIGNYYESNVGTCADGNGDKICDTSYTSGAFTDTKPLFEYPFNFESNIATADATITNLSAIVNLLTPTQNQSFTLPSNTSTINVSFTLETQFTDMRCDYIVDDVVESSIDPTTSNNVHSVLFGGWTNGTHQIRVECYNEFLFNSSTEHNISVSVLGGSEEEEEDEVSQSEGLTGSDIIDLDSPTQTTDNVVSIGADILAFLFNFGIPLIGILCVVGVAVLFIVLVS